MQAVDSELMKASVRKYKLVAEVSPFFATNLIIGVDRAR